MKVNMILSFTSFQINTILSSTCFTGTTVQILTLLVQKYKYWQKRVSARGSGAVYKDTDEIAMMLMLIFNKGRDRKSR